MIIAVSMIMYCSQMSNTKIKDGLMFNIDAFVCKGDACEYHVKGTIETHGDKVKYEEVNPNVH